ncbi:MAG: ATP-dependent DNA helicase [Betaproteobacteria bacterium RBG_16_66_20]|nr:MAG: ATP-dependent DNA helicase [Betaproteobacteria bacterium RBG_16_66_20]
MGDTAVKTWAPASAGATTGKLNERQREAAHAGPAPLLIIAGAGTGKTNTLAHRVAHLLLQGIDAERILLLTFTRRAAQEMTRRAQRIAGQEGAAKAAGLSSVRLPWSGTFHSVANRLIRKNCHRVGLEERFSVLDRGDAADLLDVARHELGYSKIDSMGDGVGAKRFPRKDTCLAIYSHRVNTQGTLEATLRDAFPWCAEWEDELKKLFGAYVEKKLNNQALDYDDLLLYWHAMMADEALAREVGEAWDHVLVDEYQDTNVLQAEILQRLRPSGAGLTVVGDDAQSIYSFRAASIENILNFENSFEKTTVVVLEENYRSTQQVLDAANALMKEASQNHQKNLRSRKKEGNRPRYVTVADDAAQAQYVVTRVLEAREQGVDLRRQAVLFRSSHHSDVLELELVRRNIPYVKYGGLKFLEAAHVKDALALLRWADNPRNRVAAWRALQLLPGVGPIGAEKAFAFFYQNAFQWQELKTSSKDFNALMQFLGDPNTPWPGQMQRVREWYAPHLERLYEAPEVRMGDLQQLENLSSGFESREKFVTELALDPAAASGDRAGTPLLDEDYLILSTVHSAKGQEWEAVYLLNVSDGNFPNEFAAGKPEQIEEERRLLYVAMTRAKATLDLISPLKYYVTQQSRMGDRHVYGAKSRFLTRQVLACFEQISWSDEQEKNSSGTKTNPVDVAGKLRGMWA